MNSQKFTEVLWFKNPIDRLMFRVETKLTMLNSITISPSFLLCKLVKSPKSN